MNRLREAKHEVKYQVLNTRDLGLPQNRQRTYVIATAKGVTPQVHYPTPVKMMALEIILSKGGNDRPWARPHPTQKVAIDNKNIAIATITGGPNKYRVMDHYLSAKDAKGGGWSNNLENLPALLHSRTEGLWMHPKGKTLTVYETMRAQGVLSTDWQFAKSPDKRREFRMLGNAMSMCVIQPIIYSSIMAVRTSVKLDNPWHTGKAQKEIEHDAYKPDPYVNTRMDNTIKQFIGTAPPTKPWVDTRATQQHNTKAKAAEQQKKQDTNKQTTISNAIQTQTTQLICLPRVCTHDRSVPARCPECIQANTRA